MGWSFTMGEGGEGSGRKPDISTQMSDKEKKKHISKKDKSKLGKLAKMMKQANEGKLNEGTQMKVHHKNLVKSARDFDLQLSQYLDELRYSKAYLENDKTTKKEYKNLEKISKSFNNIYLKNLKNLEKITAGDLTEGKLNEGSKVVTLPNGIKVKIDFKGLTFVGSKGKPVFLDRTEMEKFFKATARYLK